MVIEKTRKLRFTLEWIEKAHDQDGSSPFNGPDAHMLETPCHGGEFTDDCHTETFTHQTNGSMHRVKLALVATMRCTASSLQIAGGLVCGGFSVRDLYVSRKQTLAE
jgi:hypothetical protein|tara:strand:- start:215 stop:535 length:321 start_codon:yes stop_codon:yes gene_type:complete